MKTRQLNRLSARTVSTTQSAGLHCDGGGLYLQVTDAGSKAWLFRYRSPTTGKTRDMGLGSLQSVGLAEARTKATALRNVVADRRDPIDVRDAEKIQKSLQAAKTMTFTACAEAYIASHRPAWRNEKHGDQWTNTISTYCQPVFDSLPVQEIDTTLVLQVLEPIWTTLPETASRLRGRIENILDWAKTRGYRTGENPARWKGHLNQVLPAMAKKSRVKHHKALPFSDIGTFMSRLGEQFYIAARCLEFTILTAARTCESIKAKPEEFDLDAETWTIPASRMKAKKEHRVPLSPRAVEIVREMQANGGVYVFHGAKAGKPMSNMAMLECLKRMKVSVTVHGFRSTFRDWAAECSSHSHEVCEMALAHTISNDAEAAYRRGDLFAKRRLLMQSWAEFCAKTESAKVMQIRPQSQEAFASAF